MNSESLCAPGDQPEKERKGEKEREQGTGTKGVMEQKCFNQHGVGIYTVVILSINNPIITLNIWFIKRKTVLITI